MAQQQEGTYDADRAPFDEGVKTELAKIPEFLVVDQKKWRVKRSGAALKKIIEINPEGREATDEELKENPTKNVDELYQSISYLLVDPEDKNLHPDPDQLSEDLDFEVAQEFLGKVLPRTRDTGAAGQVPPPVRPGPRPGREGEPAPVAEVIPLEEETIPETETDRADESSTSPATVPEPVATS